MEQLEKQQQQEVLSALEKGRRLYQIRNSEGWGDLLDILEAEVVLSEYRLMNAPSGSSTELLRDLHAHARAGRSIFEQLQLRMNASIEASTKQVLGGMGDNSDYTNL